MNHRYINHRNIGKSVTVLAVLFTVALFAPGKAYAHCDGMDGPVVKAAQKALEAGNVNLALIWVQKQDEREVRSAFQKTVSVRKLNQEARELADRYFFETLVRLHRAGEGEPYTGLKPAGRDLGPAIPAADKALDDGSAEPLLKLFPARARAEILESFREAIARKNFDKDNVNAGREYVKAYVTFIHHVEHLYKAESEKTKGGGNKLLNIPQSLKAEHAELHEELARAIKVGGKVGETAKGVAELLHPHFVKEEEYALPPLGLLSTLAEGRATAEMRSALAMTDRLRADLPHMLQEHKAIVAALEKLIIAARQENKPEYARFAEKLMMHARNEEEVLYPAAILVGEYLKLKLGEEH